MTAQGSTSLFGSIGWQAAAMLARLIITVTTLAVLVRIAGTEVMALYGIAWIAVAIGFSMVQSGAAQTLIVISEIRPAHITGALVLTFGLSVAFAFLLVLLAPLMTRLYGTNEVMEAYRLAALFTILMPLGIIDMALAQKELEFRLIARVQTFATAGAGAAAIGLGYYYDPLIGLFAIQGLIGPFQFLIFRLMGRRLPLTRFGWAELAALLSIGMHLALNSLAAVLMRNLPQALVALFLPLEMVGIFALARRIVEIVGTQIGGVVNQVIYPTFARMHNKKTEIGAAFLLTSPFTAMLMLVPLVFLGVAPDRFMALYAGEVWRSGGPVLAILIFMQAGLAMGQNIFSTFQAVGKPSVAWKWNLVLMALQTTLILLFPHTLTGAALAMAVSTLIMPVAGWLLSRELRFSFWQWLRSISITVLLGVLCGIVGNLILRKYKLGDSAWDEMLAFFLVGSVATLTYISIMIRLNPKFGLNMQRLKKLK